MTVVVVKTNKAVVGSGHGYTLKYMGGGCGIAWNTQRSGCAIAVILLSVYGHFRQFWGGCSLDVVCLKRIILFANIMSLKGTVMSQTSQHHTCIGHMTFHYKRATDTSVGASCLLFVHSSGLTLSPETRVWLVSNTCGSQCV